jgi:2-polyprenyl-6-methoxyphenol hydroxylase-like FAD-dependent oxidoreductase
MAAKDMKRYPPTGINVAIIGGGIGGLAAAIECHRKGHNVRVFERRGWFEPFGR